MCPAPLILEKHPITGLEASLLPGSDLDLDRALTHDRPLAGRRRMLPSVPTRRSPPEHDSRRFRWIRHLERSGSRREIRSTGPALARWGCMKTETMVDRIRGQVPDGEIVLAASKTMPRGAAHEVILGAAGAVVGGTIDPVLTGAGSVLGGNAGAPASEAGRQERAEADLAVGSAAQVLLVVTDGSLLLFAVNALGRPKHLTARLERSRIASVDEREAALFGQKMLEIVVTTTDGAEVGFGVAKAHRRQGEAVLAALR